MYHNILVGGIIYSLETLSNQRFFLIWSTFGQQLYFLTKLIKTERTLLFSMSAFSFIRCP